MPFQARCVVHVIPLSKSFTPATELAPRAFHYIRCSFVNRINRRGELFFFISALNALVWSVRGAMTMFNEAILMV